MLRHPSAAFVACFALSVSVLCAQSDSPPPETFDGDAIFGVNNRGLAVSNLLLFTRTLSNKTIQNRVARERAIQEFRDKISKGADDNALLIVTIGAPSDSLSGLTPVLRIGDYGVFGTPNLNPAEAARIEQAVLDSRSTSESSGMWVNLNKNDVGGASDLAAQMNRTPAPGSATAFPRSIPGATGQIEFKEYNSILGTVESRIGSALVKSVDIVYEADLKTYRKTDPVKTIETLATKRTQYPETYFLALLPASSPRSAFNGLVPLARIGDHVIFAPGDIPPLELRDLERAVAIGCSSSAVLAKAKENYFRPQIGGSAEARQLLAGTPEGPIYEKPVDPPPPRRQPGEVDPPKGKDIIMPKSPPPPPSGLPGLNIKNRNEGKPTGFQPGPNVDYKKQAADRADYNRRVAERKAENKIKKAEWEARARADQAAVLKWSADMLKQSRDTKNAAIVAREQWVASWARKSDAIVEKLYSEGGRFYLSLRNTTPLLLSTQFKYGPTGQSLNYSGSTTIGAYGTTSVELMMLPEGTRNASYENLRWSAAAMNYMQF